MKVISLFDGMSCLQIALKEHGSIVDKYYASEVDKFAIKQTQLNFPNTIQLGDITEWRTWDIDWSSINLIGAGSPCQGFSFAGKQLAFDDPRSKLFFVFVEILNHCKKLNPDVKYLLENVNMKKDHLRIISEYVGIFPEEINSALVSAQNRERWYWTNIRTIKIGLFNERYTDIPQPEDEGILLRDILQPEEEVDKKYYLDLKKVQRGIEQARGKVWHTGNKMGQMDFPNDINKKAKTLTTVTTDGGRETNHVIGCVKFGRTEEAKKLRKESMKKGKDYTPFANKEIVGLDFEKMNTITCATSKDNLLLITKLDRNGNIKPEQDKASSLTVGGHGCGNHSDMDIICVDFSHRNEGIRIYEDKAPTLNARDYKEPRAIFLSEPRHKHGENRYYEDKAPTIQARYGTGGDNIPYVNNLRRLTPLECSRLQTIPSWYKWECSDSQSYRMLGNGWTVKVIQHIISFLK